MLSLDIQQQIIEAAQAHAPQTGYSPQMLKWGFEHMFSHWTPQQFQKLIQSEIPEFPENNISDLISPFISFKQRKSLFNIKTAKNILFIAASTVPSAAFQDIMLALLLPVSAAIKPASNCYDLFLKIHHILNQSQSPFADRFNIIEPTHDDDCLRQICSHYDTICISGSDTTIDHFKHLCPNHHIICHGHKVSVIVLFKGQLNHLTDNDIDCMALDCSVWDQTGCLSPKCIFAESSFEELNQFAPKLISSLDKIGTKLPEIPPDLPALAHKNSALRMARLDGAQVYSGHINHDNIIIHPSDTPFHPVLLPRTLNIYPTNNAALCAQKLAPHGQALGFAELPASFEPFAGAGYNYYCTFGHMQDPPLAWIHDGIGSLRPFIFGDNS